MATSIQLVNPKALSQLLLPSWCLAPQACPKCCTPYVHNNEHHSQLCSYCAPTFSIKAYNSAVDSQKPKCLQPETTNPHLPSAQKPMSNTRISQVTANHTASTNPSPTCIPMSTKPHIPPHGHAPTTNPTLPKLAPASKPSHPRQAAHTTAYPTTYSAILPATARKQKRGDRNSQRILQKLIQGWSMLNKPCPTCSTTLVHDASRRQFCVDCDCWVDLDHCNNTTAASTATSAIVPTTSLQHPPACVESPNASSHTTIFTSRKPAVHDTHITGITAATTTMPAVHMVASETNATTTPTTSPCSIITVAHLPVHQAQLSSTTAHTQHATAELTRMPVKNAEVVTTMYHGGATFITPFTTEQRTVTSHAPGSPVSSLSILTTPSFPPDFRTESSISSASAFPAVMTVNLSNSTPTHMHDGLLPPSGITTTSTSTATVVGSDCDDASRSTQSGNFSRTSSHMPSPSVLAPTSSFFLSCSMPLPFSPSQPHPDALPTTVPSHKLHVPQLPHSTPQPLASNPCKQPEHPTFCSETNIHHKPPHMATTRDQYSPQTTTQNRTYDDLEAELVTKLHDITELLHSIPNCQVDQISKYLTLINHITLTLHGVRQLQKTLDLRALHA